MLNRILFLNLAVLLASCSNSPHIEGTWRMHQIIQDGNDVTEEHDPFDERIVQFSNGQFVSDGRPFGKNTGTYTYDGNDLFLDSDAGEEDDSYWKVSISGDTMAWTGVGSAWAERFQIIQVRSKP